MHPFSELDDINWSHIFIMEAINFAKPISLNQKLLELNLLIRSKNIHLI
jgi:hypothetical protein